MNLLDFSFPRNAKFVQFLSLMSCFPLLSPTFLEEKFQFRRNCYATMTLTEHCVLSFILNIVYWLTIVEVRKTKIKELTSDGGLLI